MRRLFSLIFCLLLTLSFNIIFVGAIKIDGVASMTESWSTAYSKLLVDSVSESGNLIYYARAFATNEGDFLYLKLDAIDGPAPEEISPEGIEIFIEDNLFSCFINENSASDFDRNLFSFEYETGRSIDGFTAEMCIGYKAGLPDSVSLVFVLTDSVGEKSMQLPFTYNVPKEETTSSQSTTATSSVTKTSKQATSTRSTTNEETSAFSQPESSITHTQKPDNRSYFAPQATASSTDDNPSDAGRIAFQSESNTVIDRSEVASISLSDAPISSSVSETKNTGEQLNRSAIQSANRKKLISVIGCSALILTACVGGTVNFKNKKHNDINKESEP